MNLVEIIKSDFKDKFNRRKNEIRVFLPLEE